ncbi:Phospholipase A2 family protein [Quillaja saponaria]|uniref:phospholipase A2 n=1 Tax=Quillaja saponaria TaxID=32244 RepID=A0AAD7Q2S0_QUISA|nr:Phospholipase A2 family protein [Quillaja saponaria]
MQSRRPTDVPVGTRVSAVLVFLVIFLTVFAECNNNSGATCSRTCIAESCNSVGIRYGKYCGVGHTGCPGEQPCDDLDACCKTHDDCVSKRGMTNVKCHQKFKSCIKRVQKSGKAGFSRDCPYNVAMATMEHGMDLAILLSQFGNNMEL